MPTILRVRASNWTLEVAGRLPSLPPHIGVQPNTTITFPPHVTADVWSRTEGRLRPCDPHGPVEPLFFENVHYDLYLTPNAPGVEPRFGPNAEFRSVVGAASAQTLHFALSYRNLVGDAEIGVHAPGGDAVVRFEVFPRKLDYRTDYVQMRDEVASIARQLVMAAQRTTFGSAAAVPAARPTLNEWISLIERYFDELCRAVSAILNDPKARLVATDRMARADRARRLDETTLSQLLRSAPRGLTIPWRQGLSLPARVFEARHRLSLDTPENRYLKRLLLQTKLKLFQLSRAHSSGDEDGDLTAEGKFIEAMKPKCRQMLRRISGLLAHPVFQEVSDSRVSSPHSLVLQFNPHYAKAAKLARLLGGGLSVSGGPLRVGLRQISTLYEYWCFLRVVAILGEELDLVAMSAVRMSHTGITLQLTKGRESTVTFRSKHSAQKVALIYNRMFASLPTLPQQPDNVIELFSGSGLFLFDAKYRLGTDDDYVRTYGGPGPTAEDVNVMHRYRDAIVIRRPVGEGAGFRAAVKGAIVLFPFADEAEYRHHRFCRSIGDVEIGGLPFLPSATALVREKLASLLVAGWQ